MDSTLLDTAPAVDYAGIFDRLAHSLDEQAKRVAAERASAPRLLAELLALSERARRRAVLGEPCFHSYTLADHSLECAGERAETDLGAALDLARLARLIASRMRSLECGKAALDDLRERALATEARLLLALGGLRPALAEPALTL
jgi:hypothetical protein